MPAPLVALFAALRSSIRSRLELEAEILALRHQLAVLQRQAPRRPRLGRADRLLWVLLSRRWPNWRRAVQIVTPDTVVRWHRLGFARYWRWRSRRASQTWRAFLANRAAQLASIDFLAVPTATLRVLFVFIVLSHDRRRIVHPNVTSHPTAAWTAQQLREAWPWDRVPRFVIRDRDTIYGAEFRRAVLAVSVEDVLTAPRSPWQNPFVERVIGSLRRECLDHVIVWNERAVRRHLQEYLVYYHEWRTHLSLDQDAPVPRAVQPPTGGSIRQVPHLGGGITITNGAPPDRRVPHHEPLGRHSPALARVCANQPASIADMSPPRGLGSRSLISVRLIGRYREELAGGRSYW